MMSKELHQKMEKMFKDGNFLHLKESGLKRVLPKLLEEVVKDEHIEASETEIILFLADLVISYMYYTMMPIGNDDIDEDEWF